MHTNRRQFMPRQHRWLKIAAAVVFAGLLCLALVHTAASTSATAVSRPDSQQNELVQTGMFPAVGAREVCPDTPLRITFANAPVVGAGRVKVFDAANNNLIEAIDVSVPTRTKTIGGLPNYNYYPVIISGNQASLYLPNNSLAYAKTYYITIEAGAFKDSNGKTFAGLSGATAWRFSTKRKR